jgi:hypothetical protein
MANLDAINAALELLITGGDPQSLWPYSSEKLEKSGSSTFVMGKRIERGRKMG